MPARPTLDVLQGRRNGVSTRNWQLMWVLTLKNVPAWCLFGSDLSPRGGTHAALIKKSLSGRRTADTVHELVRQYCADSDNELYLRSC